MFIKRISICKMFKLWAITCVFSLVINLNNLAEGNAQENVALGKHAVQASTSFGGLSSRAVDGNTSSNFDQGSCSHTNRQSSPWWRVDLGYKYEVNYLNITNRGDCCSARLSGFEIRIGNSLTNNGNNNPKCGDSYSLDSGETREIICPSPVIGRYVNIIIPGRTEYLTLCEVQVFGSLQHYINVALGKPTVQTSTEFGGLSSRAVDGNTATNFPQGFCSHTSRKYLPWWRVDLGSEYKVHYFKITNRGDCCFARLSGFEIRIGNSLTNNGNNNPKCGGSYSLDNGETREIICPSPVIGRYVNIIIPDRTEYLTLCEVQVFGSLNNYINVALAKHTVQASTEFGGLSSRGVDGNTATNFDHLSCTHTNRQSSPWWRVDLVNEYEVHNLKITNRGDCCSARLSGFEIRIGNSLANNGNNNAKCGGSYSLQSAETREIFCPSPVIGRYVNILIPGKTVYLTLCEVQVFGSLNNYINVALGKDTIQPSTSFGGLSSRAVDGNTGTNFDQGSCTHTNRQSSPWWRLDLGDEYEVRNLKITNRGDCCSARLSDFEIRIGNSLTNNGNNNAKCGDRYSLQSGETRNIVCPSPIFGRYVNIIIPGRTEYLTLCEVQLFGFLNNYINVAFGKDTVQPSTAFGGLSSRAVDGNTATNFPQGSCTHTDRQSSPWWRVDLGNEYTVHYLKITNRGDCCSTRLSEFEISVGNSLANDGNNNARCGGRYSLDSGETREIVCPSPLIGRYVNIAIPGRVEYLTLCEVQVFGLLSNYE